MEHLFTSFFRSTAAGSFKEHRMVFQTAVPERIENADQVRQAEAAHEELSNSGDVKRAAEVRLLLARTALTNPALGPAIAGATARMDRNVNARNAVPLETTRLEVQRTQIATKLNTPADRVAGVDQAVAQIAEARVKLAELGDNARPDSLTSSRVTLSNLYREQIKAIQDIGTTNKIKTTGTTEVTIAPVLTGPEKDRLTKPFSNETGQTDASKLALGRGYVAAEGAAVEGPVANNEFRLNIAPVNTLTKLVAGKWQVQRIAVGADPANAAVAYADPLAVAAKYDLTKAPFDAAGPAQNAGQTHNRMVDNLIALNAGTAVAPVAAGPLGDMINRANGKEATDAAADLTALDTDQAAFFAGDFNAGVGRLNAAITPEAKTAALDNPAAPLGLRVMVKNRREALWTKLKTISEGTRPSNFTEQAAKIMDHLAGPVPNGVGARLRAEEVRAGVIAAPVAPTERLGTDAQRKTLTEAIAANRANLNAPAVTTALAPFGERVTTLPGPQQASAVQRLTAELGVAATTAADGVEFALVGATIVARPTPKLTAAAPVAPTERLGTDAQRKTLTEAIAANRANLNAPAVTTALAPFGERVTTLPGPQQASAVQRLTAELGVAATTAADGVEFALVGATIVARPTPKLTAAAPAPERKERNERMSEFMKVLIELVRALLQIEQQRSASIDRFLTRSLEQQQKFMSDMQMQMKAIAARPNGRTSPEFIQLEGRYKEAQSQIKTLEARVKEMEGRFEAAAKAARGTRTLEVRWSDDDRRASRPPVVCVRAEAIRTEGSATVAADIALVRREVPLVATTSVVAPAPGVPSTAFYVGAMNIDNRATVNANIVNSPGSRIDATAVARTDVVVPAPRVAPVVRADAPPPPPRITGTGPRREGSLNG